MNIKKVRKKVSNINWLKEQALFLRRCRKSWVYRKEDVDKYEGSETNLYKYEMGICYEHIDYYDRKLRQIDTFIGYLL